MTDKVADKDYFRDAEGNVTSDESKAATLLVRKGQEMNQETADLVGGADSDATEKVAQEGEVDANAQADDAAAESAKAAKPSSNKKASPSKNKGAK